MSADLFAEFGADPPSNPQHHPVASAKQSAPAASNFDLFNELSNAPASVAQPQQPPSTTGFGGFQSAPIQASQPEEDDDWGDFEGGVSFELAPAAKEDPFAFTSSQTFQPPSNSWNISSTTHDPFAIGSKPPFQPKEQTWQRAPIVRAKKSADPSVLFDAEDDFNDDDDFGDFEGTQETRVPSPQPATSSSALVDLLGDMSVSQPQPSNTSWEKKAAAIQPLRNPATANKGVSAGFGTIFKPKRPSPTPAVAVQKDDDGWDKFDDWEASIPTKISNNALKEHKSTKAISSAQSSAMPPPILSPATDDAQPGELPPTNIPPPGVLLSSFPSLFAEAQEKLFKPMAAQPLPMRNKLMAEPTTITYLQGYLVLANVAAHIIAGRKLRWKRDQHLSQGMRIGPASSRATSGMKLTGIDKGENLKEEREVADVVRQWKEQVGRLRHVVSGVNQIKAGTLDRGPDLQEAMPVKTLKQGEGGMPSRQACMLCGLKRDERVTTADLGTDDSFGEWWVDQVNMHRGCRNFWNQHKDTLRHR